jgi:hypothetical protein
VPYPILPRSSGRWSFSYRNATFTNAKVFMEHSGTNVPVTLEAQAQGYGDNTLVWVPQGIPTGAPPDDTTYTVTVSNVVVSSQSRVFTYEVTLIDPDLTALAVQLGSNNTLALTWPASSTGYTLQQNSALTNSAGWTAVSPAPQIVGNQYLATVSLSAGQRYYRLRKP